MADKKFYFIVADVHGFYDEMIKALSDAGFDIQNDNHVFVSLGDLLDRGDKPMECLRFVNSLPDNRKILVRGNHEDLMDEALGRRYFSMTDAHNGTLGTAELLVKESLNINDVNYSALAMQMIDVEEYKEYNKHLVDYASVGDYVFVHGWVPCEIADPDYSSEHNSAYRIIDDATAYDWIRARWINGMDAWVNNAKIDGKTICCGHWHTSYGHSIISNECESEFGKDAIFTPFERPGICALDACTVISGFVNCKVVEV